MNKKLVCTAVACALGMSAMAAQAAILSIQNDATHTSFFTMGGGTAVTIPGTDGQFINTGTTGVVVDGVTTQADLDVDAQWSYFYSTGSHHTNAGINVLTNDAAGNVTLGMSGWAVQWNAVANIPMGSGAWNGNPDGVAIMTCDTTCASGENYSLVYSATVPDGDPSNFGNVPYLLQMEGVISGDLPNAVPVPAAVWLFGSGLLGLVGVARRKKKAV